MADPGAGLRCWLLQLQEFVSAADRYNAAGASYQLIRGLGQECVLSTCSAVQALQISLVFSKEFGLLVFIRKSLSIDEFRDCREEALKFLCVFLEKIDQKVLHYSFDIKNTCISVYTKDRTAKCKIPALDLLIKLLKILRSSRVMDEFKIGELFNKFYGELVSKSKLPDTVLEKVYELLGVLGEVHPSEMVNHSENLFRAFLGELKTQMTSTVREPKFPVLAGCLKGLSSLLCNFTKSMEEDPQTSKEIFGFTLKAIRPQIEMKRYAVPLAGLRLLTLHASQFTTCLLDNYITLFEVLSKWCNHTNVELKKAAHSALESFLKQISFTVAEDAELHKSKLKYFMEQFYGIIRNADSNNKDLAIAIRGYGLFAGPCKVINAKDVDFMYVELIQRCKQMFLTQTDATEDHVYQMPSFLQSIASVLLYLDTVPEVYTPVLEHLMVVQIDSFPQYSPKMQLVCCKALVKVFLSLTEKGPVHWNCISAVVHQGLIRICSKPVVLQKDVESRSENRWASEEVRMGRWKVPTYKDYVDLFQNLLGCDQMADFILGDETFLFVNSSLKSLNHLLYDEFIRSVLKIVEKLDLTLEKQTTGEQEDERTADVWVIPTSDPAANLHPIKPNDFSAFINLVEFCREILPKKQVSFFEPWVYSFAYELILQSTRLPLISGFYKLLSIAVKNARKIKYFEGVSPKCLKHSPENTEKHSCFALFAKFGKEVSVKMKQYKDELLASCLTFVLSLPPDIIKLDVRAYVPALQMAFKLGLSHLPLAEIGLHALKEWSVHIDKSIMQPYYKDIVPCLDGYLNTSTLSDETKSHWEVSALSRAARKGFNRDVVKLLKRTRNVTSDEALSLEEIRIRVVQILGSLGGQINKNLITATSGERMKKYVAWDREKRLSFAVPFREMKPVIYLDVFLPRVTELALSASDRQTKVAACELLHSMVMFMLGRATQMPEGQGLPPMYQLYKHMFPVLLKLACDVDQVTRQLYEPLVMQLIHWFTNNKKFESQDTVALLEAILDGIVDPVDSTLRDFCGQCVQEFLKWSIKQTTPQQQEKSPVNSKSLFKRLYSLALHPNAFKRLGAALAFNHIYKEFREEGSLVEQFVFEALVTYMESLALAHADEKSLGTIQQCCDAIDHLRRIIEKKYISLNKAKKRRLPRGFPPLTSLCLLDLVKWLFAHCGRPQTECRHKSIELFYKFVPLLPGNKSPSLWLRDLIKAEGISFLINTFEGGASSSGQPSGILAQPTLLHLQGPVSLRGMLQWLDHLLAALECYNTFIEEKTVQVQEVLGTEVQSSLLKSVAFFLESIATCDARTVEQRFGTGLTGPPSVQEEEKYNYSKCTVLVRIMEFTTTLLVTFPEDCKLLEKDLCNTKLMKVLVKMLCEPLSIGFNIGDVQVMNHLPSICVNLLKALRKSPYRDKLETHLKEKVTAQSVEELCAINLCSSAACQERTKLLSLLSACKQLHKAGFSHIISASQSTALNHSIGMRLLSLVYNGIAPAQEKQYLQSLDPSCKSLASGLLELAFAFGGLCEHLVSLLLNSSMLSTQYLGSSQRNISFSHGEYFYSLFPEVINTELLKSLDVTVSRLLESSSDNPKMVSTILNGMLDMSFRDRAVQKHQGLKLATAILQNWRKCDSWWAPDSAPESKTTVLSLLAKMLQIDSTLSFDTNHSSFSEIFTTYANLLADTKLGLHLKGQAVILLPFFTRVTEDRLGDLKHILEKFIVLNFPMKSDEFPPDSLKYNNYVDCMKKFLDALELSQSPMLLQLMTDILCREQQHIMEELFQTTFKRIARRSPCVTQLNLLESVYTMFRKGGLLSDVTQAFVDRSLLTLLWHCDLDTLKEFFSRIVVEAIDVLKSRFTKLNDTFDTQITKKMCYYKMLAVMYSRLLKDDVHSKESKINQAFQGSCVAEGNELTKTLLKLCHDAFTENMAGESQLLEKRRLYHCAAYNCAISLISRVFNELKFYQGFLFSEKPEKNLFIFENLIDLKRCYTFPIEVEVPMERKKKYVEIRKEARDAANGASGNPRYMSSLSYLTESSLSEEMSQFDFSTGVQSYSYSSQDRKPTTGHFQRREHQDSMAQDDIIELEMDELNQHECMAPMTSLIKHMQRNVIAPKGQEGSISKDLPPWMKFLHDKLENASVSLNIRLFLAKLVINTEEVFRPYAKHWLGPLLQLAVCENIGEGIHYMIVEIVATILSWTGLATPTGVPKYEVLANRLLYFLMKYVFHPKRAVFRHNLEIIKTLVECWKECLSIPYRLIFEKFSNKDPNSKDNSVGIQLLGIVVANNLPPYDLKGDITSAMYFEALVNNMSFVKYKEVYAAAAEVLGLILQHVTERKHVIAESVYELVVKQLKQHQNTMEDKFIVCLNKIVKGFPPLADRFLNALFFLLPKFHGVMKTLCLEVVLCRAEAITGLYLQLKSKDFLQVMRHRDDERQKVCLDIIYKMVAKLKPTELRELLNPVVEFVSHPSPTCREQMYNILMWIHDNYRDPESQMDEDSQEIFKLAKDVLIQGLIDENLGLQLIIRNFWSHETRLPSNTLDRLLALNSLYSPKIEVHFLSLATNFLLEMTRMSPDYLNPIFEHPLSECEFQEYTIDPDWRFRSTVLTPMFIETQAFPSTLNTQTQEGSPSDRRQKPGQVRATQQQYDFTPTQTSVERSSFDWLTGSSIDLMADHTVFSSESLSSSLLFSHKKSEKSQRVSWKSVGPDFGTKKLGLPGDEVDNQVKSGTHSQTEILRLRRRFLKDQEKLSLLYAKRGLMEQKLEKDIKSELKMKQDAQVVLYRSYRHGDLPDIQIQHSSLITPLQAVAQKDPIIAKQLFSSLFSGILKEMHKFRTTSEKNIIIQNLLQDFNRFLNTTFLFFPPFVSCIQEISCQHVDLLTLDPAAVRVGCLASLQQPGGIRLLEEALLHLLPKEPPTKRIRGKTCLPPDVLRWMELAKLYRSIGEYDVLHGIFSSELGTKQDTQNALLAEARSDYFQAANLYKEALNKLEWLDGEPTEAEKEFWEMASLDCYNNLSQWKELEYRSTVNIGSENSLDLSKMWSKPFYQETYLPYVIRSKLKLLLQGEDNQSLLTFVDEAMHKELQQMVLELQYSQELSLLYILQDDIDRATYYIKNAIQIFMQNYSSIDVLLYRSRLAKLQSVQTLAEIEEFLNFIRKHGDLSSLGPLRRLLKTWTSRYPDTVTDPMHIWDDIITNRCFFLSKIEERLTVSPGDHSMSVDEDEDSFAREGSEPKEDAHHILQSCRFTMKMKMIESSWKQNNFSLSMKLLKEMHKESKIRESWRMQWIHSFCQLNHCRSHTQSPQEQVLTMLKTITLLDESDISNYLNKNIQAFCDQNILLGTSCRIMADALSREPACLSGLEKSKTESIFALSGSNTENTERVISGLYQRAFHHLSMAVQSAEEETQLSCWGHEAAAERAHAYMTLVGFCDQQLRKVEESASTASQKISTELEGYPALVVEKMLRALKLNSSEARLKFPRLLQIIEQYPEETVNIIIKEISSIPCWQFIGWIGHMVALLDKEEAIAVQHTVEEIADNYPQAIIYPFIISSESYSFQNTSSGHNNKAFVERIKSKLDQGGVIQGFINALDQLSNPDMLFKDWVNDTKDELGKNPVNKKNIEKLYERMYAALGDFRAPGLGPFRRKFIQTFGKEFVKSFGNGGSKLLTMKLDEFRNITDSLFVRMRKDSKLPGNLKEYSPWMSEFTVKSELEIPGQYDGKSKPLPEYHVRISGFDERVKVMVSLRKPKRIVIRGHDEKEYPFLVKGGEDLRQDQRIEQLFEVMNAILSQDAACSQRNMQLRTYRVVPMTSRLGLIEWIENTMTLKDLLLSNMSQEEKVAYDSDSKAPIYDYRDWLIKVSGRSDVKGYTLMYRANRTETVTAFRRRENKVPADLLKRAFVKMSTSPEAFLALRSHFASSHALLCISHWLLGIGDRHLNNFMVAMETGSVIGIDFGHAFGSATQFLPIPELMPFRLTRQFISLMLPMKETGLVCTVMVHALRAFRSCAGLLTDTMEVFVKEPSFDWKGFEQTMLRKGGSWIQEINVTEKNWYPQHKIRYAKRKLAGANPAVITCDELRLGHEASPAFRSYVAVARGNKDYNIRAQEPESRLSEETQVKCLVDQATDPNILGRTWEGWEPWM
ncbi:DNA-dependent protein kinase catalytic subunit isoform X1 [Rattus norvegicus]|uniref:DNA-dependent protein kinase catalytic subunit isoform X1 n=1 Tax=Rattus norvegicus TaxID=10116 RepID=UPI0004E47879|nr:DNA-dependent protein kinase catalytic subunit isoform X1 [Rattus norvegicus]|eukprot:XP_008767155.1 PREDICTED: DNA-dependent protein kinase catalytic subunit isoform X2 [Rattus norvegicus]